MNIIDKVRLLFRVNSLYEEAVKMSKPFYLSKTIWFNALALLATWVPGVKEAVGAGLFDSIWATGNLILRFATHEKVSLGE